MLLSLPLEVVALILEYCDWRGILSCSKACRRLKDVVAGSDSLKYPVALAASGLQPSQDWTDATLAISEKLVRVREYDRSGSRGGQLSLFCRHPGDTARNVSCGHRFQVRQRSESMMDVIPQALGGPRCSSSSRALPIITIPNSLFPPTCVVDAARGVMIVIYETEGQWICSVHGREESDPATFPVGSSVSTYASGWQAIGDTLFHYEQETSSGNALWHVKDIRSGSNMLTIEDPYVDLPMFDPTTTLVAEDMLIRMIGPDPVDVQRGLSPELCVEVLLLNGTATPTTLSLGLPPFNDRSDARVHLSRPPAIDGKHGQFDGLATSDDNILFHAHIVCRDDVLLLVHVNELRAQLRAHHGPSALTWDEWAAHARCIVLRPPPSPERMEWHSATCTSAMRVAVWLECWHFRPDGLQERDTSAPDMRRLAILDAHPHRVARAVCGSQVPFALSEGLRGSGPVGPFKEENVYAGGLTCVEYTYVLPLEVSREGWNFEVATTLDGIVIKDQNHVEDAYQYTHCAMPRRDV